MSRRARARDAHPDHHLWRNGRYWWIAVTTVRGDGTRRRIRRSLETEDLAEARRRRDAALEKLRLVFEDRLRLRYLARAS